MGSNMRERNSLGSNNRERNSLGYNNRKIIGRSSVSAGHTVSQTMHSIEELTPAPLVPLSGLQDGACSDMSSDCH